MTTDHRLIQFKAKNEMDVSAYQLFRLHVKIIHSFLPDSRIYFIGCLDNSTRMFEDSYQVDHSLQPDDYGDTILPLNMADGTFPLPSIYSETEIKPLVLYSFTLNLSIEQMSYSLPPYQIWWPIEARGGNMFFPPDQSILHSLPSLQHPPPNATVQQRVPPRKDKVKF